MLGPFPIFAGDGTSMGKTLLSVRFHLNGQERLAEVEPSLLLIDFIRDHLDLPGTKKSCGIGVCGACTVLLDGRAVSSCSLFAFEVDGRDLMTIEGMAEDTRLHPLQKSFLECGGLQCGYCTPGMILLARAFLEENPEATEKETREYMDTNLCRCTGYQMIVESVLDAAEKMKRPL